MLARQKIPKRNRKSTYYSFILKPNQIKPEKRDLQLKPKFEQLFFKFSCLTEDIEELNLKFKITFPFEE